MARELRVKEEVDLSLIKFGYVSYNKLRDYITGRRMYFNCRINTYEDLIICIGVFYRGFLCGGVVLTKMEQNEAMIQTWYSREDRGKEEVDLSLIRFGYVSYNKLRDYITGRRMYFNCRINTYEDLIICIGVFYRGFLCG